MTTAWTAPNAEHAPPRADEPPLHRAAREGDHAAIRALAARGADLDAVFDLALDPDGRATPATPLMVAAGSGDGASVETVALLLALGADPARAAAGRSAADFACSGLGWNYRPGGDAARLRALLDGGAPLTVRGSEGARLVTDLAAAGDAERLAVALARGAPANAVWDPAVGLREHEAMLASLGGLPVDERAFLPGARTAPWSFEIPLCGAAASGSEACVKLLLAAGADARQRDNQQRTALFHATSVEAARALVAAGASLDDRDAYGWTPLMSALGDGATEEGPRTVRALLAAGADPNATYDRGYTVLMCAVGSGRDPAVLRLLLDAGADPHATSELGYNAFHAALDVNGEANAEDSVRATLALLRDAGVDLERRNREGHTPLARALLVGTGVEARALCELGADPNAVAPGYCDGDACPAVPLIFLAIDAAVDADEKVAALLAAGADLAAADAEGRAPLDHARARLAAVSAREGEFARGWVRAAKRVVALLARRAR